MQCEFKTNVQVQGFTLLELLVVISVLTLIMTASFGALRLGNRAFEAGISRANQTEHFRATADLLRRQFSQLVPIIREFDGETVSSFIGNDERIRFIAPAPQNGGNAGLFVYTISSQRIDGGLQLVFSYASYDPGQEDFNYVPVSRRRVLIGSLSDVRFAYYGATDPDDTPDWHAEWFAEDAALPRMVRIVPVPLDATADWPELSFIIRAGDRE
jgi:prepilin-type N-terminal cleavage/methylation domain-containing protein